MKSLNTATPWPFSQIARITSIPGAAALLLLLGLFAVNVVQGQDQKRLDDWTKTSAPNENTGEWNARKFSPLFGSGNNYFYQFVHKSDEEHYLHVKSGSNNSFSVGMDDTPFKVQDWPVLSWEWKVAVLPTGGNVRMKEKDDQAGAMCVIVNPGLTGFESMCYIWENAGPKDTPITSTKNEDARYLILRTAAEDKVGQWIAEKRNILKDFERLFKKKPQKEAIIGIQIDSNDTESSAEAFYRNLVLSKQ